MRALLETQALRPAGPMTPQQIADLIARDRQRSANAIRDANIKISE